MLDPNTITEATRAARATTMSRPDLAWARGELDTFADAQVDPDPTLAAALALLAAVWEDSERTRRRLTARAHQAQQDLADVLELREG